MQDLKLDRLYETREQLWREFNRTSRFACCVLSGDFDSRLLAVYLIETHHYAIHNPRHQSLIAARNASMPVNYRKFCLRHAEEETGHELMALHDLRSLGVWDDTSELPAPLFQTEMLNAYLYWISSNGNPLQRLGYSFWAEDSYQYFGDLLASVVKVLKLSNSQLTFLISHSDIDAEHSAEVVDTLRLFCRTEADVEDVHAVMASTLHLQFELLNAVYDQFDLMRRGGNTRYRFADRW